MARYAEFPLPVLAQLGKWAHSWRNIAIKPKTPVPPGRGILSEIAGNNKYASRYHVVDERKCHSRTLCEKCGTAADSDRILCKECGATLAEVLPLVGPSPESPRTCERLAIDALSLTLIAAQSMVVVLVAVPNDGTRLLTGVLAYGVLVTMAPFMWYGKEAKKFSGTSYCVKLFLGSILLGCLSFGVDVLIGSSEYPGVSPIKAGTKVGSPLGFGLTVLICPGITMVALASIARSLLAEEKTSIS